MAREEHVGAEIEPYNGGGLEIPYAPPSKFDVPTYLDAHPIEDGPIQAFWAKIITWYRYTLIFRLWLTERWYRVAITLAVIAMIITYFKIS